MQTLDIDKRIEKLLEKAPTFEKYNLLGDLYLQKGNREAATECFYKAAGYARRDKAIAVYKKIIKITPEDTRPYHELISIYADLGLIAEEKKYLLLLARICHVRDDAEGEKSALKKVSELDPADQTAQIFLSKGEVPAEVETEYQRQVKAEDSSPLVSIIEESIGAAKEDDEEEVTRKPGRKFLIPVLLIAAVIVIGVGIFVMIKKERRPDISETKPAAVAQEAGEPRPIKTARDGNLQIDVVLLPAGINDGSFLASLLDQKTLSEYAFYAITVRAIQDCIPHESLQSIPASFSLLGADGKAFQKQDLQQLRDVTKVVYKSNVCNAERGIVFFQFYQAYAKEPVPAGFSLFGKNFIN